MNGSSFQFIYRSNILFQDSGAGAPLELQSRFSAFRALVESTLERILRELGLDWDALERSLSLLLERGDCSAASLRRSLDEYCAFLPFCRLMERKYQEIFRGIILLNPRSPILPPNPVPQKRNHVRVFWDLGSIPVASETNALSIVARLNEFFEAIGIYSNGIDYRMIAFLNSNASKHTQKVAADLNNAIVEVVWVQQDRAESRAALAGRMERERAVLPGDKSTFVIISSDVDSCKAVDISRQLQFQTIVIHNYSQKVNNFNILQTVKQSSDFVFSWESVLSNESAGNGSNSEVYLEIGWFECSCNKWKGKKLIFEIHIVFFI